MLKISYRIGPRSFSWFNSSSYLWEGYWSMYQIPAHTDHASWDLKIGRHLIDRISDWPNPRGCTKGVRFVCLNRYIQIDWKPFGQSGSYGYFIQTKSSTFLELKSKCLRLIETFQFGYWNINSGKGCEKCTCDPMGAVNNDCDDVTGQCLCKPGVGGPTCSACLAGYWGFSPRGCTGTC